MASDLQLAFYTYDQNGNRLTTTDKLGNTVTSSTDQQDRLTSSGTQTFTYDPQGQMTARADSATATSTHYSYDAQGDLHDVTLPGGKHITYLLDAGGRRVAKEVDGQTTDRFLYGPEAIEPVAKVDDQGQVTERYVYATSNSTPDYIVKGGHTYRVIADQLGSVRRVIDIDSEVVAEAIDYDAFGRVTSDSNPGFQPFGFAGGLEDSDTGLVHFGAREYDPELGRFTTGDPLGFAGGSLNLQGYGLGDPVNLVDPSGMLFGLHFEMPTLSQVATRYVPFVDGVTGGLTDQARSELGLQGGLDKCSIDYRAARTVGYGDLAALSVVSGGYGLWRALPIGTKLTVAAAGATIASNPSGLYWQLTSRIPVDIAEKLQALWEFIDRTHLGP